MYFFIALIGFLAFSFILSLLSIIKVEVDTTAGSITFIGLLSKKTIATADIKEYLETVHKNPFKAWYGLLIKTHDNQTIQLAGQNIESLSELKDYLTDKKISYAGQRKMKFPFN